MEFRWNRWNLEHATRHGVFPAEAESVIRGSSARYMGDGKYRVQGRGRGDRFIQVIYIIDPEKTVYIVHARPLTDAEKEQFYSDCETIAPKRDIPLTTAQRKLHTAARRPGRPRKGKGTQIVSLSIEKDLLRRAERVAKAQGVSRSDLFSRGLLAVLAAVGAT